MFQQTPFASIAGGLNSTFGNLAQNPALQSIMRPFNTMTGVLGNTPFGNAAKQTANSLPALMQTDNRVKKSYNAFVGSVTPQQQDFLKQQYNTAAAAGESSSFDTWSKQTGMPNLFGGFQNWPQEFSQSFYTPKQLQLFGALTKYLQGLG